MTELLEARVSKGTSEDVERVVRRDFAAHEIDAAFALLADARSESWGGNSPSRIRLATLKMANGNLAELERAVKVARSDFRDVFPLAEYPRFARESICLNKRT